MSVLARLLLRFCPVLSQNNFLCLTQILVMYRYSHIHLTLHSTSLLQYLYQQNVSLTLSQNEVYSQADVFLLTGSDNHLLGYFHRNLNQQGVYFIILENATPKEVGFMAFTFWSHKIYNVTIIVNGTTYKTVNLGCSLKLELIESKCNNQISIQDKVFKAVCPLNVNWISKEPYFIGRDPYDGYEYLLLKLIADNMKRPITWLKADFKGHNVNGTWVGALGKIQDIAGGGFIMTERTYRSFKLTYPHYYDSYIWYAPSPRLKKLNIGFEPL